MDGATTETTDSRTREVNRHAKALTLATAFLLALASGVPCVPASEGEESGTHFYEGLEGLSVGGLWYLSYQHEDDSSQVAVKRGYINIQKKILRWGDTYLEGRITPDAHQDDTGDIKVRLKYAYGKLSWKGVSWQPWLELGVVHMPWLDFEEHINLYRMQDTMFVERNGTFNSADFGVTFGGFLGGNLDGVKYYPGRYGSFAVGVYNGGGYHAKEENENKALEGRLTLRPLPGTLPGLQLSYFGLTGKGNRDVEPDWNAHLGMLSYEHERGVLTATYYSGDGNQKGTAAGEDDAALARRGYSFFGELRLPPGKKLSLILRYDRFDPDDVLEGDENDRYVAGLAWDLGHHNTFLLDYDRVAFEDERPDENRVQLTLQIKF